ncbi:tetratricopeptide repeat-containing sensor histidine kinase [Fulvivirga maritima]|uniref:ATP-binding protein n=1 Tax=Fulvivirga maritima TaxID=2904247 RepID=UPI001F423F0C|nr:tetratricopeptide repeat-containing sensor histidine kinase [Fulvivirga maritima]UII27321.1 tetratricopeptide repeat-containing sensor histidine kinase [Fulvivirga maritima]
MKIRGLFFIILFFCLSIAKSQDSTVIPDFILKKEDGNELQVHHYFDSIQSTQDSAMLSEIYNTLEKHGNKNKWPLLQAALYKSRGDLYFNQNSFVNAIHSYQKGLDLCEKYELELTQGLILFEMAQVYEAIDKKPEALESQLKAYSLLIKHDSEYAYNSLSHMADIHYSSKNYDEAIEIGKQAINLIESLPPHQTDYSKYISVLNTIGIAYREKNEPDSSIFYLNHAAVLAKEKGFEFWEGLALGNLGLMYQKMGKINIARELVLKDYRISLYHDQNRSAIKSAIEIGKMYQTEKNFNDAKHYYDTALFLIDNEIIQNKLPLYVRHAKAVASWYEAQGDFINAFKLQKQYIAMSDSLSAQAIQLKLAEIKATNDFDTQVNAIKLLTKNGELQKQKIQKQNLIIIASITSLLFIITTAILIYRQLILKKRDHLLLEKHKDKIEAQNTELEAQSEQLSHQNKLIQHINTNLEQEVQKRTIKLKKLNEELDTFIYRSSHDIRQPIATILGLENIARTYVNDGRVLEVLAKIKATAASMDNMLWKLQMSYLLNHDHNQLAEIQIEPFLLGIISIYNDYITHRNINLTTQITPFSITNNPELLKIVLRNIVENALHFSDETSPEVEITGYEQEGEYILKVSDNGEGINPNQVEDIYKAFYKANTKSQGNGLGLYLAAKAADILNINIDVNSSFDKGTTFTLSIPVKA